MWFNPAEITKFAKPPAATLATLATYHPQSNAECPKVAEVATTHDSKIAPLHDLAMERFAKPDAIVAGHVETMRRQPPEPSEMDRRSMRVLAMLEAAPGTRYAIIVEDTATDPVVVTVAVRGKSTFELEIPRHSYDGLALLELIEKHSVESGADASPLPGIATSPGSHESSLAHPSRPAA